MFGRLRLLAVVLALLIAGNLGGARLSWAAAPPPCTSIACTTLPASITAELPTVVAQFPVSVVEPNQTIATAPEAALGALEAAANPSPSPSPSPVRQIQPEGALAAIIAGASPSPSPSPSPIRSAQSLAPLQAAEVLPSPSPSPSSRPVITTAAAPTPAQLTPALINGKPVLTLTAADAGRSATVPVDTSIYLRFGPGDYHISVDPPTGVLEGPRGTFALPKNDIGLLVAVGRGSATITVTEGPGGAGVRAGPSTSNNWSGYVAQSGTYTSITGSWEVPAVQATSGATNSSTWIGIDGSGNSNLIQTGTEQDYTPGSGTLYRAWWEIIPAPETVIPTSSYPVNPGDGMSAQISQQSGNSWLISLTDNTAGWTFQTTQTYTGAAASAEWIQEAPGQSSGPGAPVVQTTLASYGQTTFDSGTDNGSNPGLTTSEEVALVQAGTQVSTPSAPDCEADGFAVAYSATAPSAPPCPPPAQTFNQLSFNITTGGDDLRGDSSATATVALPDGTQTFTLKAQSDGSWPNGSNNVRIFPVAGPNRQVSAIGPITITLTSHNGFAETDDNWDIQSIYVQADGATGSSCVFNQSGNPFKRLTGSGPSVTLNPGTGC